VANDSRELAAFAKRWREEIGLTETASADQAAAFWAAKSGWMTLHEDFAELLLVLENQRLQNANVRDHWLTVFGAAFVAMEAESCRAANLRLRVELKEAAGYKLTREQLEQAVAEAEEKRRRELEELEFEVSLARYRSTDIGGGGQPLGEEDLAAHDRECKRVLFELFFLLHKEKLLQNPAYHQLTDSQKNELAGLWTHLMAIKKRELGIPQGVLGHRQRLLTSLLDILATAKTILANAGLATDVRLIPQGETLAERLEWLERSSQGLERDSAAVRDEIRLLLEDPDTREKAAILEHPDRYEAVRTEMCQLTERYRQEADELQRRLDGLFRKGPCDEAA
jgi:hypothetical protein